MKKLVLFAAILALTIGLSYLNSEKLYNFYIKTYYKYYLINNYKESIDEAKLRKKKGSINEYINYLQKIYIVYPKKKEVNLLLADYYYSLDLKEKSVSFYIKSLDRSTSDYPVLIQVMPIMEELEMYSDMLNELKQYELENYKELLYYYGVGLYYNNDYKGALKHLVLSLKRNYHKNMLNYYISLSYEKLKEINKSINYMEKAYFNDKNNKKITTSLIRLYKKGKMYDKAAYVIRTTMAK